MKDIFIILFVSSIIMSCSTPNTYYYNKNVYAEPEPIPEGKIYIGNVNIDIDTMPYLEELGRHAIYRNQDFFKEINLRGNYRITTHFCVDRKGTVIYAEVDRDSTTVKDFKSLKAVLNSLVQYKFNEDNSAPFIECGTYKYKIDTAH